MGLDDGNAATSEVACKAVGYWGHCVVVAKQTYMCHVMYAGKGYLLSFTLTAFPYLCACVCGSGAQHALSDIGTEYMWSCMSAWS